MFERVERVDHSTGEVTHNKKWVGQLTAPGFVLHRIDDGASPKRQRRMMWAEGLDDLRKQIESAAHMRVDWVQFGRRPRLKAPKLTQAHIGRG